MRGELTINVEGGGENDDVYDANDEVSRSKNFEDNELCLLFSDSLHIFRKYMNKLRKYFI